MDDLLKKLQEEAGLSEEQAVKAVSVIKDRMEKGDVDVDWNKVFKGKYDDFLEKAQSAFKDASTGTSKFVDKLSDKTDDLSDSVRLKLKNLSQRAVDFLEKDDDNKKE